jgi:hypothetical protein
MPVIASVIKSLSNQSSESTGDEITILKIEWAVADVTLSLNFISF